MFTRRLDGLLELAKRDRLVLRRFFFFFLFRRTKVGETLKRGITDRDDRARAHLK